MSNVVQISAIKPIRWDFTKLAKSTRPTYKNRKVEQMTYFVSTMITKNLYLNKPFNSPVHLHTDVLREVYGRRVKEDVLDPLIGAKLLSVDDAYSAGNYSKSYRLCLEGYTQLETVNLVDSILVGRIRETNKRRTDNVLKNSPESQAIYHTLTKTTVEYEPCLQAINNHFQYDFLQRLHSALIERYGVEGADALQELCIKANAYKGEFKKVLKNQIRRKYKLTTNELGDLMKYAKWRTTRQTYITHLDRWRELGEAATDQKKDYIWFKTDKSGRIHHNATSTPKLIRQYLKVEGEELVEVDAKNSQWFMLVAYLRKAKKETVQHILYSQYKNRIEGNTPTTQGETPTPTKPPSLMLDTFYSELDRLQSLLENSGYRSVMALRVSRLTGDVVDEKNIKSVLIKRILFEDPNKPYLKKEPIVLAFKEMFPVLYKVITGLKMGGLDYTKYGYKEKDRYKALAVELQKMESDIFIRGAHQYLKGVLRLSIHDALLLRKKDVKTGLDALQITCKKQWGINLKVTLSNYQSV